MSTFKPSSSYDLKKHTINFTKTGVEVIEDATSKKVDGALFSKGFDIKVIKGDFCFGTITFQNSFDVTVSLVKRSGGFEFKERGSAALIVGSDELDIPQVTKHIYDISKCPMRMKGSSTLVTVKCPCDTSGSPCTNACYTKQ